jgi:hypothetical protein
MRWGRSVSRFLSIKKEDSLESSQLKPATLATLVPLVGFLHPESSRRCPVSYVPTELKNDPRVKRGVFHLRA